ncbi:hypothetical protein ECZU34_10300 [Escherichia coli]|nr:hypothetical protein ECZU34_10300 [Escherichia coli]
MQWLAVDNATAFAALKREAVRAGNAQAPDAPASRVLVAVAAIAARKSGRALIKIGITQLI